MSSKVINFFFHKLRRFLVETKRVKKTGLGGSVGAVVLGGGNAETALGSWLSIKTASRIICEEIDPTIVVGNGIHGNFV